MHEVTSTEPIALVLTTEADRGRARTLARSLVDRKLAACVSVRAVESVYRWEDEVVDGAEVEVVVKTTPIGVAAVCAAIDELHSYDLPEIVVLDAVASAAYGGWVVGEVGSTR